MIEIEQRQHSIAGSDLECLELGDGSPLLFLHGGLGPAATTDMYLRELGQAFRVVAPWHPGFGDSGLPESYRNVGDLAYAYLDLLAAEMPGAVVVGASFGGWIAAEMAVRSTSLISSMVLVDPVGIKVGGPRDADIADQFALSRQQWSELTGLPGISSDTISGMSTDELQAIARGQAALARFGWKPNMYNPSLRQWLHRIDVPALIIRGSEDRVVAPGYHEAFASAIPGSRLLTITGAGHYPHLQKPREFAEVVARFAAETSALSALEVKGM